MASLPCSLWLRSSEEHCTLSAGSPSCNHTLVLVRTYRLIMSIDQAGQDEWVIRWHTKGCVWFSLLKIRSAYISGNFIRQYEEQEDLYLWKTDSNKLFSLHRTCKASYLYLLLKKNNNFKTWMCDSWWSFMPRMNHEAWLTKGIFHWPAGSHPGIWVLKPVWDLFALPQMHLYFFFISEIAKINLSQHSWWRSLQLNCLNAHQSIACTVLKFSFVDKM